MEKYSEELVNIKPVFVKKRQSSMETATATRKNQVTGKASEKDNGNGDGNLIVVMPPIDPRVIDLIQQNFIAASIVIINRTHIRLLIMRNANIYVYRVSTQKKIEGANMKLKYIMNHFGDGTLSVAECLRLMERFEMRPDRLLNMDGSMSLHGKFLKFGEKIQIEFRTENALQAFFSQ
jgi:hypothetical protein